MARKKKQKEKRPADYWTNPYYREEEERKKKLDPDRPMRFTYLCMPIGAAGGIFLGWLCRNMFIGVVFGFVMGIMIGTKLYAKFPPKEKKD